MHEDIHRYVYISLFTNFVVKERESSNVEIKPADYFTLIVVDRSGCVVLQELRDDDTVIKLNSKWYLHCI